MDWHKRAAKIEEINEKIKLECPRIEDEGQKKYKQRLNRLFRNHCKIIPKCKKCKILLFIEEGKLCENCERWSREGFSFDN